MVLGETIIFSEPMDSKVCQSFPCASIYGATQLTGVSPSSFCQRGVLGGLESTSHLRLTSMPSRSG